MDPIGWDPNAGWNQAALDPSLFTFAQGENGLENVGAAGQLNAQGQSLAQMQSLQGMTPQQLAAAATIAPGYHGGGGFDLGNLGGLLGGATLGSVGLGIGGASGANLGFNAGAGNPLSQNAGIAAGADVAGLAGAPALAGAMGGAVGTGIGSAVGGAGAGARLAGLGGGMPQRVAGGGGINEGSGSPGLFDTLGNLSPAILAGILGNSQRQGINNQVGLINQTAGNLNGPGFMNAVTNPYDQQTGLGRTALTNSLQQRGVGGSSFGNQQLDNYDYQRGIGRGDLATRAGTQVAATQGSLYNDALRGMVQNNQSYNNLLGAGLGASGSLFNRGSANGLGGSLGNILSGLPGAIGSGLGSIGSNLFGSGGSVLGTRDTSGLGNSDFGLPIMSELPSDSDLQGLFGGGSGPFDFVNGLT